MKSTNWKDIVEMVGIATIVASLVFVGLQLRQSQALGYSEIMSNMSDRKMAMHELIADHADIWHKACAGEELDPPARIIAGRILMALIDDSATEYFLYEAGLVRSESEQQRVIEKTAAQVWIQPGLRKMSESYSTRHQGAVEASGLGGDWAKRIAERLEDLDNGGVVPRMDTTWCGAV